MADSTFDTVIQFSTDTPATLIEFIHSCITAPSNLDLLLQKRNTTNVNDGKNNDKPEQLQTAKLHDKIEGQTTVVSSAGLQCFKHIISTDSSSHSVSKKSPGEKKDHKEDRQVRKMRDTIVTVSYLIVVSHLN